MGKPIGDDELSRYEEMRPADHILYSPCEIGLREAVERLVGEVRQIRDVMTEALGALEDDDIARRRAAFDRIQEQFEGVTTPSDAWVERAADEIAGDPSCLDAPDRIADIIRGHKERGA